jgi:hypothetical protein
MYIGAVVIDMPYFDWMTCIKTMGSHFNKEIKHKLLLLNSWFLTSIDSEK